MASRWPFTRTTARHTPPQDVSAVQSMKSLSESVQALVAQNITMQQQITAALPAATAALHGGGPGPQRERTQERALFEPRSPRSSAQAYS